MTDDGRSRRIINSAESTINWLNVWVAAGEIVADMKSNQFF